MVQNHLFKTPSAILCLSCLLYTSITALNNGLIKFPGVILFTSHDHQFVQTTANRIMEILPDGKLIDKITTYDAVSYTHLTISSKAPELTVCSSFWCCNNRSTCFKRKVCNVINDTDCEFFFCCVLIYCNDLCRCSIFGRCV